MLAFSFSDHDTARWNLSPAEVQKRRALFWELFITDCWQVHRLQSIFDPPLTWHSHRVSQPADSPCSPCPSWTANYQATRIRPFQMTGHPFLAVRFHFSANSLMPTSISSSPCLEGSFWLRMRLSGSARGSYIPRSEVLCDS
jgi:hypothetical protein